MKKAMVIFNGIRFPYSLVDYAIAWAEKNNGSLHALFIKAGNEADEGYVFPSDLDSAEDLSNTEDAAQGDVRVIQSQIKVMEDMAKTKQVAFNSEQLTDPSLEDVLVLAKGQDIVILDHDFNDSGTLSVTNFKLEKFIKKCNCPVEVI